MTPEGGTGGAPAGASPPALLEVGGVGRAHGLKGDVVVHVTSNRAERWQPGSVLVGTPPGRAGVARELVVEAARPLRGGWVVRFAGVADRAAAEALNGTALAAPPLPADPADPDELWVHELVGCEVWHDERLVGRVVAVEANPASDLLVLDGGELVPMVFVTSAVPGRVDVDVPEGLLG